MAILDLFFSIRLKYLHWGPAKIFSSDLLIIQNIFACSDILAKELQLNEKFEGGGVWSTLRMLV